MSLNPSHPPTVSVVIINYRSRSCLGELLDSLEVQTFQGFETLLIDNDSRDGSVEFVRDGHPWVEVYPQSRNEGYAKAANLAANLSSSEFLVILNPDIRLDPEFLSELLKVAERDSRIAAVASKMLLYEEPELLNGVGGAMNTLGYTWDRGMLEPDAGQYDESTEVPFACGGAALFRRSELVEAGGFDPRFWMYHEDVDLCWRLWLFGYRVVTAPRAVAYHHFSQATRDSISLDWREIIGERNLIRSLIKNYELSHLLPALWQIARLPQLKGRKRAQRKNFLWNLLLLPDTLAFRARVQRKRRRKDGELAYLLSDVPHVPVDLSRFQSDGEGSRPGSRT